MEPGTTNFLYPIRPTARAVIRRDGQVLVQLKQRPGTGEFLTLPGGRQEPGETLENCIRRECAEEIGARVHVARLLHVAEVHKQKDEGISHQLELLFDCSVPDGYEAMVGPEPDKSQKDTIWVDPRVEIDRFRPSYGESLTRADAPLYLGVFHV